MANFINNSLKISFCLQLMKVASLGAEKQAKIIFLSMDKVRIHVLSKNSQLIIGIRIHFINLLKYYIFRSILAANWQ